MKKLIFILTAASCGLSILTLPAQAQLINYNRKTINSIKRSEPVTSTAEPQIAKEPELATVVETTAISNPSAPDVDQFLISEPAVATRIEHIYDLDRDGKLQQEEITEFLSDVVSSIERRGSFSISSNLLKQFDQDADGQISRLEADQIKQILD